MEFAKEAVDPAKHNEDPVNVKIREILKKYKELEISEIRHLMNLEEKLAALVECAEFAPFMEFAKEAVDPAKDNEDPVNVKIREIQKKIECLYRRSLSTTFRPFPSNEQCKFEISDGGYDLINLEKTLAAEECAEFALAFKWDLLAILSLSNLLRAGDHIIFFDDLYGGLSTYFRTCISKSDIKITFVDMRNVDNIRKAIMMNTKMIWIETPTNTTGKLIDIRAVSDLLRSKPEIILVVDNTLMSSNFQKPLKLGAHVVIHSMMKNTNDNSGVKMGAIATSDQKIYEKMKCFLNWLGGHPSPFDCFVGCRVLKCLPFRMKIHRDIGLAVAKFLENHEAVERVIYPGLESHPQYELAKKQCTGSSSMVSFYIKGGLNEAQKFMKTLKLFLSAESLNSLNNWVDIPSLTTHASVPPDQRKKLEITDNLIRLSVGLEVPDFLIEDLRQALEISMNL